MVLINVQYDAYNRQFTLLDGDHRHTLEDGETYLVVADLPDEGMKEQTLTPEAVEHVIAESAGKAMQ